MPARHPAAAGIFVGPGSVRGGLHVIEIDVVDNIDRVVRFWHQLERREVPFASAKALTFTARDAATVEREGLDEVFRQPTPWTRRGIRYTPATKAEQIATVFVMPQQGQYLSPYVFGLRQPGTAGGERVARPVNQRVNRYGNLTRGTVRRLLVRPNTFAGRVNGVDGIWQRAGGRRNPRRKLLVAFDRRQAVRRRYMWQDRVAQTVFERHPEHFIAALRDALRSAERRSRRR